MDQLSQDLRYAFRTFLARPGFTAVVIVTLGLGIGTNSAIFTLVNAIMFKPLPVHAPEGLVNIYMSSTDGSRYSALSYQYSPGEPGTVRGVSDATSRRAGLPPPTSQSPGPGLRE